LLFFTKKFHPSYDAGWVHEDICRRLEQFSRDVTDKKAPRLMLLVPPRHGKSELASIRFPAWHLGHHPSHEVINCGYNTDLPMKFSRKVREMMRDKAYQAMFSDTKLDPDSQSVEAWNTTMGGGFTAAGVGGGITGKGAHVLIIDDPIKNMEESDSSTVRDGLWDWYWSTAYTRLSPGGGVLCIQTFWNDDDLAGRLQKQMRDVAGGDQFVIIKYPALAEFDEYLTQEGDLFRPTTQGEDVPEGAKLLRQAGEALHPERYSTKMLENYKANMHPRIWSALYQQNPVPDEGMYFKTEWFRTQPSMPQIRKRHLYQAWDYAIGEKQQNDYTVGSTILQDENNFLHVLDVVRFKGDTFTIIEEMLNFYQKWTLYPDTPVALGVEDGQIWRAIEPVFKQRCAERGVFPPYEVLKPLTDKLVRARALQGRMQQGRVVFQEADWLIPLKREFLRFPAGDHDDIVDSLAWNCNMITGKAPPKVDAPQNSGLKSWKEKISGIMGVEVGHMAA
jgi:predicted phage terminase large subunit-like protein